MNETIGKILEQDSHQKWFFIAAGVIFSGLAAYLFYKFQGIPSQLETMWFGICTYIAAGWSKGINQAEKLLNRDLDGDGDIGVDNTPAGTTTPVASAVTSAVAQVAQTVEPVAAVTGASRSNNSPG